MLAAVRVAVVLLVATGCGRLDFDPGRSRDASADSNSRVGCPTAHPDALLCEDFESPAVSWDYTVIDHGQVERDATRAATGTASLAAEIFDANEYKDARWGKDSVLPAIASGELHLREKLWLSSTTAITDQLSILVTGNRVSPYPAAFMLLTPGNIAIVVEGNHVMASGDFPRDRWVCVELNLVVDNTHGSVLLAFDGAPILAMTEIDTGVAGGYTNVDVGIHYATPAQAAAQLWIDDVVADVTPIGCD
jgi:hypothetical protein